MSYTWFTAQQIEKLFDIVIAEGKTAKEAEVMTGINIRTAQHYIKNILMMRNDACLSALGNLELDAKLG